MKKPVPLPPDPIHKNRPLVQTEAVTEAWTGRPRKNQRVTTGRPLVAEVMKRVGEIMDARGKDLTRKMMADDIGAQTTEVTEWIGGWRSAPNSERLLQIIIFMARHDRTFLSLFKDMAARKEA